MPLRLRGGLPRLAQSSLSLLATGRTAFIERRSPMPRLYVGADDSRCEERRDANQARVAVLLIADFISPAAHAELGALS